MEIISLTSEQLDEVFEEAETPDDIFEGLYKLVYGEQWSRIKGLKGRGRCSRLLHITITGRIKKWARKNLKAKTRKRGSGYLMYPAARWRNSGWTIDPQLEDLQVIPAEVELQDEEEDG